MRMGRRYILLLSCGIVFSFASRSQEVTAVARLDSTRFLIGDRIVVHVGFEHREGASFQPLLGDTVGGFQLLARGTFKREGDTRTSTDIILGKYSAGQATIPPLEFFYEVPGRKDTQTVSTNPLNIEVSPVAVDTALEIKDVKAPLSIAISLAEILLYGGIVVVAGVAAYFLWKYLTKRKKPDVPGAYQPPPKPAHVLALEELALLRAKKLWQQGSVKQYYSEATEILRRYIENRFRLMALEETTDEIMAGLEKLKLNSGVLDEMDRVLRRADLVKFAKYLPGATEHEEILSVVYDVVDKTKVVAMAPAPKPDGKAGLHVGA